MKKQLLFTFLAASTAVFCASPVLAQSEPVISEIMYNPPEAGADSLEFIEIYNPSTIEPLNLQGYYFSSGIDYTFPIGSIVPAEGFIVVSGDSVAFESVFGVPALEWTLGGLSNDGEALALRTSTGLLADTVFYDDNVNWPAEADQGGASLVLCNLAADNNDPANWAASTNDVGFFSNGLDTYADPYAWFECMTVGIADYNVIATAVYPNPAKDAFTMRFAAIGKATTINIFNSLGQVVYAQPLSAGTTSTTIDANLESGFYVIRLNTGNSTESHQLIVE